MVLFSEFSTSSLTLKTEIDTQTDLPSLITLYNRYHEKRKFNFKRSLKQHAWSELALVALQQSSKSTGLRRVCIYVKKFFGEIQNYVRYSTVQGLLLLRFLCCLHSFLLTFLHHNSLAIWREVKDLAFSSQKPPLHITAARTYSAHLTCKMT